MRIIYRSFVLMYFFLSGTLAVEAQSASRLLAWDQGAGKSKTDTAAVSRLQKEGEEYLTRKHRVKEDVLAAIRIAGEMEALSSRLHYLRGTGMAQVLLSRAQHAGNETAKARETAASALTLLRRYGTERQTAQAYIVLGETYGNDGEELAVKQKLYEQAMQLYRHMGDRLEEAKQKQFIGDLYGISGDYQKAVDYVMDAIAVYKSIGFQQLEGAYCTLGFTYNRLNNFVESLRYTLLAVKTGEQQQDTAPLMATIYNRLGLSYYGINYNEQAMHCFLRSLRLTRINADTPSIQTLLTNIAALLNKTGAYQQAFDSLRAAEAVKYPDNKNDIPHHAILYLKIAEGRGKDEAFYFKKLLDIYNGNGGNPDMMQLMRLTIAGHYQRAGNFTAAKPYLEAYSKAQQEGVWLPVVKAAQAEYLMFRCDSAAGLAAPALQHFLSYKTLSDSVSGTDQAKIYGELQLRYETEKKDKDIELLTHQSRLQEASLQKEKILRNLVIGVVGIMLLFFVLIYSRFRLKQRTNAALELQRAAIHEQNIKLKQLVKDKEWLVKENHHRVKNNLQIMISLLNIQSQYLENKDAVAAIRDSQHRMYAMSLIHQRLYQADQSGGIIISWYLKELAENIRDGFELNKRIRLEVEVDELELDVVQAVPIGLIVNEAVSNAIKYAYPSEQNGIIRITCREDGNGYCILQIADDGIGAPDIKAVKQKHSMGMSLMEGLSGQLNGTFTITGNNPGFSVTVIFPVALQEQEPALLNEEAVA